MSSKSLDLAISHPWSPPRFTQSLRMPWPSSNKTPPARHIFYDVKFYPYYTSQTSTPVFALVGNREIIIARPSGAPARNVEILHNFRDAEAVSADSNASVLNSCSWNYLDPSQPLISVAGPSGSIKVLNALTGEVVRTLLGHGAEINDLATHPHYPWILASASGDHSIRIWDLRDRPEREGNACLIICGHGLAHKEPILTCAFHGTGRYLISGGQDHAICLWSLPDFAQDGASSDDLESKKGPPRSSDETRVIHYPHFMTSAVHGNYVDCVCFFGDLILSKAAEEKKIVMWSITGFNSKGPNPSSESAPVGNRHVETRSAFVSNESSHRGPGESIESISEDRIPLLTRLLEFKVPNADPFYIRFSLLLPSLTYPHLHPMLLIGNMSSQVLFWDLSSLELGQGEENKFKKPKAPGKHGLGDPLSRRALERFQSSEHRSESPFGWSSRRSSSVLTTTASSPAIFSNHDPDISTTGSSPFPVEQLTDVIDTAHQTPRPSRFRINDPFKPLEAHFAHTPNVDYHLAARQTAWSPCGRWCIIAGESGPKDALAVLYERWT